MNWGKVGGGIAVGAFALATASGIYVAFDNIDSFADSIGERGREKNSVAAVVTGIVAQSAYKRGAVDATVEKNYWLNAKIKGGVSPTSIDVVVDAGPTEFSAKVGNQELVGTVDKSEFDWSVEQKGTSRYIVERAGMRFNKELILTVSHDGMIEGTYYRNGTRPDWHIKGNAKQNGSFTYAITSPLSTSMTIHGNVHR